MEQTIERRSTPRVAVDFPLFFHYLPSNHPPTKMLDLSMGGAAVEVPDPFPIGASTSFVCVTAEEVIEFRGRVVSVCPLTNCSYRIGVRFTFLDEKARELLTHATRVVA